MVVPYEHESQIIVDDDFGENTYDLENLFGTNLGKYDNNDFYNIGAIHAIDDKSDYLEEIANDMQSYKLGDDIYENPFVVRMKTICLKIYLLQIMLILLLIIVILWMDMNFLGLLILAWKIKFTMMKMFLLVMMIIIMMKVGLARVSTLGSYDPTISEGVESYWHNDKSEFGEVMTLFSVDSASLKMFQLIMMRTKLLLMMIIVMILML